MTKQIPLNDGQIAVIDDEDYDLVAQFEWRVAYRRKTRYAARWVGSPGGTGTTELMHRLIAQPSPDVQIDHIDGDGLNNTRGNLRPATQTQNRRNRGKTSANKSGYKGVRWHTKARKWFAAIGIGDGRYKHLGLFIDPADAARAYDRAACEYFGEFANTNFPR